MSKEIECPNCHHIFPGFMNSYTKDGVCPSCGGSMDEEFEKLLDTQEFKDEWFGCGESVQAVMEEIRDRLYENHKSSCFAGWNCDYEMGINHFIEELLKFRI